jgi:hypothetical protein
MPPPTNSRDIIARMLREGWIEQPKKWFLASGLQKA